MNLNILTEIDIIFEIPSLLCSAKDFEKTKKRLVEELNKLGLNGEVYYNKNLKILEKYIKSFKKHMIINDDDMFLLDEEDTHANIIFLYVLLNNREIYENIDAFTNKDLRLEFLKIYNEVYETNLPNTSVESLENILLFLNQSSLNENSKWRFMLILDNPKKYYSTFIELINKNIDAYNKAIESVNKDFSKLINDYVTYINNDKHNLLKSAISKLNTEFTIFPSLIALAFIIGPNNTICVGLLTESLYDAQINSMGIRGDLVYKLKSLADKTKMDILLLLKSGPKYNLEIADALKLTPATVSYHMSSLLESSMVSLTKQDVRCYYNLACENIKIFIEDLESTLIN